MISVHTPVGEDPNLTISLCQTFSQVWRGKLPCTSRYSPRYSTTYHNNCAQRLQLSLPAPGGSCVFQAEEDAAVPDI